MCQNRGKSGWVLPAACWLPGSSWLPNRNKLYIAQLLMRCIIVFAVLHALHMISAGRPDNVQNTASAAAAHIQSNSNSTQLHVTSHVTA